MDSGEPSVETDGCMLAILPKTITYEAQIENFIAIYQDTILELESLKMATKEYSSLIHLKPSERYLWLLKSDGTDVDSILIHCLAPLKSVDTYFMLDSCEMEIETTDYDDRGNPIASTTKTIKL